MNECLISRTTDQMNLARSKSPIVCGTSVFDFLF